MDWNAVGLGFIAGWCLASVLGLLVMHYNRTRGYDRARVMQWGL